MRVTDNTRLLTALRTNAASTQRLTEASRRSAAGARVSTPSDDPVAYATLVRRGSTLANMSSRTRVARSSADELTIAERALDSASDLVQQAQSLAVQGANETLSQTDRDALALRVRGIVDQLREITNTRGSTGYIFGGTRTDVEPFDASGNFQGNDGVLRVPVSDGVAPRGNVSGARAFTAAGGKDAFAELNALANALSSGSMSGINTAIDSLQAVNTQIVQVQVDAGLSIERLRSAADLMDGASTTLAQSRARDAGADDPSSLITELAAATTAYTQSLEVTRRLLSLPSLASST
ncbi:Flagellar hook-associated protein FlgL [Labilithrix luteola]|uniref:Flagellar hook-associated protein FlgL n=1 Tax=Labilithrix luteola TaxID=1391654 RepID=A0A0K1PMA8_9BACT|nr:hypothetical protein [Labilithrix luteola]AKU94662.1 Flagellar hook-associated protein FlgL [Labilithrix luteola]